MIHVSGFATVRRAGGRGVQRQSQAAHRAFAVGDATQERAERATGAGGGSERSGGLALPMWEAGGCSQAQKWWSFVRNDGVQMQLGADYPLSPFSF